MTQRMKRNADFIKALHSCSKKDQKVLLKRAKPDDINAIYDIGTFPYTMLVNNHK